MEDEIFCVHVEMIRTLILDVLSLRQGHRHSGGNIIRQFASNIYRLLNIKIPPRAIQVNILLSLISLISFVVHICSSYCYWTLSI